jgi:hypothetical protein
MLFGMHFFLSRLLAWIFSFFFLSIAHTPFWHMRTLEKETHVKNEWSIYFLDEKACFCVTLSVRVSNLFVGVRES